MALGRRYVIPQEEKVTMKIQHADIGVIVGRFQTSHIEGGHAKLLFEIGQMHNKVLIILGCSQLLGTAENPLDYPTRALMVTEKFPGFQCIPVLDHYSDEIWSQRVDEAIKSVYPLGSVCLYGGRNSFIPHYSGIYDCKEFPPAEYRPATEVRKELGNQVVHGSMGRHGIIYSTQNRYPHADMCVDVVVWQKDDKDLKVALGRKADEEHWRLPGGYLNPGETLEAAARREVQEEMGLSISDPRYIYSHDTCDWRYRNTRDSLTTALFEAMYVSGALQPADDLSGGDTKWFSIHDSETHTMMWAHHQLLLTKFLNKFSDGKIGR
jgi:bifunctional NMN adenylyltransferase/nudix hydrolase